MIIASLCRVSEQTHPYARDGVRVLLQQQETVLVHITVPSLDSFLPFGHARVRVQASVGRVGRLPPSPVPLLAGDQRPVPAGDVCPGVQRQHEVLRCGGRSSALVVGGGRWD